MRILISLLFLSSCSLFFRGSEQPKSAKNSLYSIRFAESGWEFKDDKRSDYVFENKDGRILLSNSFCEEFQEQPLEQLAAKIFKTIEHFKPTFKEYTTLENREAYRLEGTGTVDGVKVQLKLLNTRRNNCYFDFLAISPINVLKKDDPSFQQFLKSVVFQ